MNTTRNPKIRQMVQLSILTALLLVLAFTPIGYLRLGPFSITFMPVPVVIGAILLGPGGGAFLGLVFGLTSFAQCFGIDPMGTALMTINLFYTFVMTVVTRTLMGYLAEEGHRATPEAVQYVAQLGDGSMRDSLSILDQCLAFFSGANKCNALCHGGVGGAFAQYVDAFFQCLDGEGNVLVKVVAKEDRLKAVVVEELVEIRVGGKVIAKILFCIGQLLFVAIANRHDLAVVGKDHVVEGRAAAQTENTEFYRSFHFKIPLKFDFGGDYTLIIT